MSDQPEDSGKTGAFFLGMLVGMLLAGGAAGTYLVTQTRIQATRAEMMAREAEAARAEAEAARRMAEEALRKAKE